MSLPYRDRIPDDWRRELESSIGSAALDRIEAFVAGERRRLQVYPPDDDAFNALVMTPFDRVRAVILGMDPYHRPGQAHGLAFSIQPGSKPFPTSLRSILGEVERDVAHPVNRDGNLTPWAKAGVLLLNAALTVREQIPGSHLREWAPFTDAIIEAVNRRSDPVVFMLWGKTAQAKSGLIDTERHVLQVRSHPSGLSAYRDFTGTSPFRKVNEALTNKGRSEIGWDLPI